MLVVWSFDAKIEIAIKIWLIAQLASQHACEGKRGYWKAEIVPCLRHQELEAGFNPDSRLTVTPHKTRVWRYKLRGNHRWI